MPFNAVLMRPLQYSTAGEFRAVITDDTMGLAIPGDETVKLPHDSFAADGGVHRKRQAFTGALIHNAQNTEPASVR